MKNSFIFLHMRKILLAATTVCLLQLYGMSMAKASTITGYVRDVKNQKPLVEAVITLSCATMTGDKLVLTDSTGKYIASDLLPGLYTITFEMEGYQKTQRDNIELTFQKTITVDCLLKREDKNKFKQKQKSHR